MEEVPSFDGGFQNLERLSVRGYRGMAMGLKLPPLSGWRMLREFCASDCSLSSESVPDINCLPSLEILRLNGNNFSGNSILKRWKSSQFSGLSKLKYLDLSNCSLNDESIPDDLSYLSSLEQLRLRRNNFVNLPLGCISNLTCLWNLDLDSCSKLQVLPVFPPSLRRVFAANCGAIRPLPETQISKFLMSGAEFEGIALIIPGNEIPAWFNKQKDCPSVWKFDYFQDSIIVDIPDCCRSSEWWGIVFCFIVKPPDYADLYEERFAGEIDWSFSFGSNSPTEVHDYLLAITDYTCNHQFTLVLDCNRVRAPIAKAGMLRLYFRVERFGLEDDDYWPEDISKCGWRVICKNEMQSKEIMSGFENITSNSSGFNESRLIEMQDGKRCHDESNLEHNETQRRKT